MASSRHRGPSAALTRAHDPLAEAQALVGDDRRAYVLEPSPPSVGPPEFSDDPATPGDDPRPAVTPTTAGNVTWDDLARDDATIATFARDRWLGNRPPLQPVPTALARTRTDLHRLAYSVVAEARRVATGRFGLRFTRHGFGTPFFGDDRQVRVVDGLLVVQEAATARTSELSTLRAAGRFAGVEPASAAAEHDSPDLGDLDRPLDVDVVAAGFLGDWFGFATAVLEELRFTADAREPSRVQLWPGHFDTAVELGDEAGGHRGTYGASPGDASHDEPYLYVGPWSDVPANGFWNATGFTGAELAYTDLLLADDPHGAALGFFRRGHELITA